MDPDWLPPRKLTNLDLKYFQDRIYGPRREKTCLRGVANNEGADQPAHSHSLITDQRLCFSLSGKYHI